MPNILKVGVENPDELLNVGEYGTNAVIRVQWAATQAGAFADISGSGSTPAIPIVTGTYLYTGYDPLGTSSTFYQTRFENAGATRVSDWSPAFQVGDETGGLLCSLYDVKQQMWGNATNTSNDEILMDIIRSVSADIESYVGAWLAPRPTNPASTMTLNFDVPYLCSELVLTSEQRIVGIRTLTALNLATTYQPETGGTYTAATLADVFLRPRPTADGPATRLALNMGYFYPGYNTVQVTGSFGPAATPYDIQSVAIAAVTRRFIGKESAATVVSLGPDGGVTLLADLSPGMRATLARYRVPNVA